MTVSRNLPTVESVVALAEHLCHEECEHDPEMGGHCADCTEAHLRQRDRAVAEQVRGRIIAHVGRHRGLYKGHPFQSEECCRDIRALTVEDLLGGGEEG